MREEKERLRLEAKKKREGRAERRRADGKFFVIQSGDIAYIPDSDPLEELPAPRRASISKSMEVAAQPLDPPSSSQVEAIETPSLNQPPASHRKGGRPPNSRKGKLGKNQYTKDKDLQDGDDQSPGRSQSRDVPRGEDNGNPSSRGSINEGKPGKSKTSGHSKITMTDMKKRVAAILEFIHRTQLEMAGGDETATPGGRAAEKMMLDLVDGLQREGMPTIRVNGDEGGEPKEGKAGEMTPTKDFKELTCAEMMAVLRKQLIKWQKDFT
jgi:hypothetical protein